MEKIFNSKCKKCGNEFEVPKNAIEIIYATYCIPCINVSLNKLAKMPLNEYMRLTAKQVFN